MRHFKKEPDYQSYLIKKIKEYLPGCIVLKNDPNYIQGIPDLSVFYRSKWAFLEVKLTEDSNHQPNQDYYIYQASVMSFGSFIWPEIEDAVLTDLFIFLNN